MQNDAIYRNKLSKDAYIIRPYDPHNPQIAPTIGENQDVTFTLQKYRLNSTADQYTPLFRRELCFNFHINKFETISPQDHTLSVRFDGFPRPPFPIESSIEAIRDEVLRAISSRTRLVFRYSTIHHQGCLVHLGYDFAKLDETPLSYLWLSASNHFIAENNSARADPNAEPHNCPDPNQVSSEPNTPPSDATTPPPQA